MNRKKLLLPEDIQEFLVRRFGNQHRNWLCQQGQWPLVISLGVPTERDATENATGVRAWVTAWSNWQGGGQLNWEERRWPRLGVQRLPASLEMTCPAQVAAAVGQKRRWSTACERYDRLIHRWPALASDSVLGRNFDVLADYTAEDFERLCGLLSWLEHNPNSGLYLRQLPVEGLDTKWIERRKGMVTDLVRTITGALQESDFFAVCGLRRPPGRIRVRVLCPELRKATGGIRDIEAPIDELAALRIRPLVIVIVENLETGLALPDLPGVVAFMKLGNAVNVIASLPWLTGAKAIYWGDIDTHGYVILDRARRILPDMESILMDKATLMEHRALWSQEAEQSSRALDLPLLVNQERAVYQGLHAQAWGQNVRLEQERIPWVTAVSSLNAVVKTLNCDVTSST